MRGCSSAHCGENASRAPPPARGSASGRSRRPRPRVTFDDREPQAKHLPRRQLRDRPASILRRPPRWLRITAICWRDHGTGMSWSARSLRSATPAPAFADQLADFSRRSLAALTSGMPLRQRLRPAGQREEVVRLRVAASARRPQVLQVHLAPIAPHRGELHRAGRRP